MPYPLDFGWKYKAIDAFNKGLNLDVDETKVDDTELTKALNVFLRKDRIEGDTGYKVFGAPVVGVPQATYQFYKRNGTSELLCITMVTLYKWNVSQSAWEFVQGTAGTTTTAGLAAGGTNLTVASIAGFSSGDRIGVRLASGLQHMTTVNGAPAGSTIVMTDAVPVGESVANGAQVLRAVVLNGDADNQVSADEVPSHDWFTFTNGVDAPKRYDGTDCVDIPNLPASGNFVCKLLVVYNNTLFLMNCTESGVDFPQRIRRCDGGDPTNWTTGTAGYDSLYDSADFILASLPLGPYLIVYRERSVIRGSIVGTGGIEYNWDQVISGEGVVSGQAVVDIGDYHIIIGNANIYEYRGGLDLTPVADNIFYRLYGTGGDLDPSKKRRLFGFYVEELDEAWLFYPSGSSAGYCDKMLRYSVGNSAWFEREFANEFVGFGFYQLETAFTWDDLVGSWDAQTWTWNSRVTLAESPTTHLCGSNSQVYEYDYVNTLDDATTIAYTVETADFLAPDKVVRTDYIDLQFRGTNVLVEYSADRGVTWKQFGASTLSRDSMGLGRLFQQVVAERLRFRISCSGTSFALRYFGLSYKEEALDGVDRIVA